MTLSRAVTDQEGERRGESDDINTFALSNSNKNESEMSGLFVRRLRIFIARIAVWSMAFKIRLSVCLAALFLFNFYYREVSCANFHQLQQRLLERSELNLPADDIITSDVKEWVRNTITKLSNKVELIGDEIEKAVIRQTILQHNQFLGEDGKYDGTEVHDLERESPSYDVLCASESGYEARQYHKALWVITFSDPGEDFLPAKLRCETKIQNYILGHNERGVKIHVTSPWFRKVMTSDEGRHRQYIFLFYLPSTFQDDPPTPLDPMIFFEFISPKVYAFSNSYVIGQDAGWTLQKFAISLLNRNHEEFVDGQYYLADYEAPFSKYSQNSEILLLMEDSNVPVCDEKLPNSTPRPFPSYQDISESEESGDSSEMSAGIFSFNLDMTTPEPYSEPRIVIHSYQDYLRKSVSGCHQDSIDETLAELISFRQAVAEEGSVLVDDQPGDVLLRVERPSSSFMGDHDCNDMQLEVLLKTPDYPNPAGYNLVEGISVYSVPKTLAITTDLYGQNSRGSTQPVLEQSMGAYFNLRDRLVSQSLCFKDQEFFVYGQLAAYPTMERLWILFSDDCFSTTERDRSNSEDGEAEEPTSNSMMVD